MTGKLVTLAQFNKLSPRSQGYASYMQAELPGSELKAHQSNPYKAGSRKYNEFVIGQQVAVLEAQDEDD